jgi:GTPase SAR1 family protein
MDPSSVTRLWAIECERYACENTPKCLIGNKCDLVTKRVSPHAHAHAHSACSGGLAHLLLSCVISSSQVVAEEDARNIATSGNMLFFETSAKTGTTTHTPLEGE